MLLKLSSLGILTEYCEVVIKVYVRFVTRGHVGSVTVNLFPKL